MKSFAVFQVLGYIVALLGSTGVQAVANAGLNFVAVTSTLTAFVTRFSNLPTLSSPSTTTVIIWVVSVDESVVKLTRTRTSTIPITLSRTLSDTKVNIPTPLEGIVSTIALDSNTTTIPSSIPSLVPIPTSSASTKQTGPSPHHGIFVSLLSSHSTAVVLPVNSPSGIPPIRSSNTAAKISQLPNPVQKFALTSPNSDVVNELTIIPPRSTVFTTIYPTLTVTETFTPTSSLLLSNLPSSDRDNPTAPAVLNLLATGSSLKENTTLKRILSTAKDFTYFSPTTFTSLSLPVQAFLSQSHSLSTLLVSSRLTSSNKPVYTKFLTVPSTTIFSSILLSPNLPPGNKSVYTKFLTVPSTTIFSSILSSNLPPSDVPTYTKFLTVPSTTIFSSILSSNLPPSNVSTHTKFLTVPSTTITQQSIPTISALNGIPAPQWPSSAISIFRGIFRNLLLPSARAATDDSSVASPTSPSSPNNNNNNSSSSVVLVRRRTIIPAEDDIRSSLSSSHSSSSGGSGSSIVPNNDNNNNNDIPPTSTTLLAWTTKAKVSIVNLFRIDESQFWTEDKKIKTMMYPVDINSKKPAEQQQPEPVRTEPSLTPSGSPTTTVSIIVMPASYNNDKPTKTWSISTSH